MRKSFFVIAAVVTLVYSGKLNARGFNNVPSVPGGAAQTDAYVGVERSTVAYSTNNILCFTGQGSLVGFVWSSTGAAGDYILFRDTGNLQLNVGAQGDPATNIGDGSSNDEFVRVYITTTNQVGTPVRGMSYKFPSPIQVVKGLTASIPTIRASITTILWNKTGTP